MKKHLVMFGILTAFLWSLQFIHIPTHADHKAFPDVPADSWYAPYVDQVIDQGIMEGLPDGSFGAWKVVDRAELSKVIVTLKQQLRGHWLKDNLLEIVLILATVFGWLSILNTFRKSQEDMMRELAQVRSHGGPPPPGPPPAPKAAASPPPAPQSPPPAPTPQANNTDPDAIEKNLTSNWWV